MLGCKKLLPDKATTALNCYNLKRRYSLRLVLMTSSFEWNVFWLYFNGIFMFEIIILIFEGRKVINKQNYFSMLISFFLERVYEYLSNELCFIAMTLLQQPLIVKENNKFIAFYLLQGQSYAYLFTKIK